MSRPRYAWRELSSEKREEVVRFRILLGRPWHSPPHLVASTERPAHHITAACYEHRAIIGETYDRMDSFSQALLDVLNDSERQCHAWCVLPNHYHAVVSTFDLTNCSARSDDYMGAPRMFGMQRRSRAAGKCFSVQRIVGSVPTGTSGRA